MEESVRSLKILGIVALPFLTFWLGTRYSLQSHPTQTLTKQKNEFSKYFVTASSEEEGLKIANALLDKKLIACCSIIDNVTSVYTWDGKR